MDGKREWFTLEETARRLECRGPDGQLLSGDEAAQAVLKLIFPENDKGPEDDGDENFPLIPSARFNSPILIYRYLTRIEINQEGHATLDPDARITRLWPCAGFPRKRFRYVICPPPYLIHPFQTTTKPENPVEFTGLLDLHCNVFGPVRRKDGVVVLHKIRPCGCLPMDKIMLRDPAFPEYPRVQIVKFGTTGAEQNLPKKRVKETDLVITRCSLIVYAELHGYDDAVRLLVGQCPQPADRKTETREQSFEHQGIRLPTIDGKEIIPLRLIPLVTEPMLDPHDLLEHLWNPRGDFYPALEPQGTSGSSWTVIDQVMKSDMYLKEQLEQFPAGSYLFRMNLENYGQFANGVKVTLNNIIPESLLKLAFEGFEPAQLKQPVEIVETPHPFHPKKHVEKRIAEGATREKIAVELKQRGVLPFRIGKLLCTEDAVYAQNVEKDTWRKRGTRLVEKGLNQQKK